MATWTLGWWCAECEVLFHLRQPTDCCITCGNHLEELYERWTDPENIYDQPSIRQSIEEERRRSADHIDGYDRDDLGESPDY